MLTNQTIERMARLHPPLIKLHEGGAQHPGKSGGDDVPNQAPKPKIRCRRRSDMASVSPETSGANHGAGRMCFQN